MNTNPFDDVSDDPSEDRSLEELLSAFRWLAPPEDMRIGNRVAVATQLRLLVLEQRNANRPWWRRSIFVPIPVAACVLAIAVGLGIVAVGSGRDSITGPVATKSRSEALVDPIMERESDVKRAVVDDAGSVPVYSDSSIYLCGFGRLSSETHVVIRESMQ